MPPIILSPIIFDKMLRLLKINKERKVLEEDSLIKNNGGSNKLLRYFTAALSVSKSNAY